MKTVKPLPAMSLGHRGTAFNMMRTIEIGEGEDAPLCQFVADSRETVDQEAFARLFVASPGMLGTLKRTECEVENLLECVELHPDHRVAIKDLLRQVREAIAKAGPSTP